MFFSARRWLVLLVLWLTACRPVSGVSTPFTWPSPQPWHTHTPAPTVTPNTPPPPLPTVTPTPRQYVVQSGETLIGIANRLGVSLEDLLNANPGVLPSLLVPGDVLLIPSGEMPKLPPVPDALRITQIACYWQPDDSTLCLALVRNDSEQPLEDISLRLALTRSDGEQKLVTRFLLLDALFPGMEAPASFLLDGDWANASVEATVLTAFPFAEEVGRYAPATLRQIRSLGGGTSLLVEGAPSRPAAAGEWQSLWVAAWAYDAAGRLVGARRSVWNPDKMEETISIILFSAAGKPVSVQLSGLWAQFPCPFCP